ncbi:hypothetical protein GGR51DRAFT_187634 [Nemania sp. FL0031]|nr:hypothetical protein GGR51DRAFT_187634 [Nemania sp. FL0031]
MELTSDRFNQYILQSGALQDLSALQNRTGLWSSKALDTRFKSVTESDLWGSSSHNPAKRIDSLSVLMCENWRIDGASNCGRRILAVPVHPSQSFVPLRIDVYLPNLCGLSDYLYRSLDCLSCVHIRDTRFSKLGLACHVRKALQCWSSRFDDFAAFYNALPFGARICFRAVEIDPAAISVHVISAPNPKSMLGMDELAEYLGLSSDEMIPGVALRSLRMKQQLNERVSIVQVLQDRGSMMEEFVFKSSSNNLETTYHEVKTLLELEGLPNICGRPVFLVTDAIGHSRKPIVVGFLSEFFIGGSLSNILPLRDCRLSARWEEKLKWSKQITKLLQAIVVDRQSFYSDLKCENIVLSSLLVGERDIVLIDFERTGTGSDWAPPEIRRLERLQSVVKFCNCQATRQEYAQLLQIALETQYEEPDVVFQKMDGRSRPLWQNLRAAEKEAAMVFALGKLLYCIFENVPASTNVINPSSAHESPAARFPEFTKTPPPLRTLITHCTAGTVNTPLERIGNKLYGWTDESGTYSKRRNAIHQCTAADALEAGRQFVLKELEQSKRFVLARARYRCGTATSEDTENLPYLRRPSLRDVGNALDVMS